MLKIFWKIFWIKFWKNNRIWIWAFLWNRKNIIIWNNVWLWIWFHISVSEKWKLTIWNNTQINRFFTCWAADDIFIWNDCLLSYNISIQSANHSFGMNEIPWSKEDTTAPIYIWDRCFIWCWAVILKWVTLGDNCVVGANAVVKSSFPNGSVISWNPAILIRSL